MVINKSTSIIKSEIEIEIKNMEKKYSLNEQEKRELEFIINAFCKFYKKMNESDSKFTEKDVVDIFDSTILDSISDTYNNTGLQTRANIFYKNLPTIFKMSSSSSAKQKSSSSSSTHYNESPRTYNSRNYDYGGCGGSCRSYGHC